MVAKKLCHFLGVSFHYRIHTTPLNASINVYVCLCALYTYNQNQKCQSDRCSYFDYYRLWLLSLALLCLLVLLLSFAGIWELCCCCCSCLMCVIVMYWRFCGYKSVDCPYWWSSFLVQSIIWFLWSSDKY